MGAFNNQSQHVGGQLFACTSLVDSALSENIFWITIDSTATTNLKRSLFTRGTLAGRRMLQFLSFLLTKRIDSILIFSADRGSFVEKGLMVVLGKVFQKRVILCPRSGLLLLDTKTSAFWRNFTRIIFSFSDHVICQGHSWKQFFQAVTGFPESKFIVIPNWINTKTYTHNYEYQHLRRFTYPVTILFMGWVTRDKGIFELLESFKSLESRDAVLLVAGEGQDINEAKAQVCHMQMEERVRFLGWVRGEEKSHLLKTSDIFILPSHYEGMPNSVLEAMASGVPVIGTKVGGVSDLILDGVTGFLVESQSTEALTKRLVELVDDGHKRRQFAEAAYRHVKENHTLAAAIEQFKKIL